MEEESETVLEEGSIIDTSLFIEEDDEDLSWLENIFYIENLEPC